MNVEIKCFSCVQIGHFRYYYGHLLKKSYKVSFIGDQIYLVHNSLQLPSGSFLYQEGERFVC